jgi:hypothetical protein
MDSSVISSSDLPAWFGRRRRFVAAYPYQPEEDALLRELYGTVSLPYLAGRLTEVLREATGLPHVSRSPGAVYLHARNLGLELYTGKDEICVSDLVRLGAATGYAIWKAAWSGDLPSERRGKRRLVRAGDWEVWLATYRARRDDLYEVVGGDKPSATPETLLSEVDGRGLRFEPNPDTWKPGEDRFLEQNLGWLSLAEIGEALGRSENAVKLRRRRLGLPAPSKHPNILTTQKIAEALGVDPKAAMRWVDEGILPGRRLPMERVIRVVRRTTFLRWFINPRNWVYFSHGKNIRDPHLRRLFELKRERWGDEWWSTGQVAEYHGVDHRLVNKYVHDGKLPPGAIVKWNNWWILRSAAVNLRFYTGKGNAPSREWAEGFDAFVALARAVGCSWPVLARSWSTGRGQAGFRLKYLGSRIPALTGKYGLRVHFDDQGQMLADWKHYRSRFPTVARAMDRFGRRAGLSPAAVHIVRSVLATWMGWHAANPQQSKLAATLRHAANILPATLYLLYRQMREWGVDPLNDHLEGEDEGHY